jgi:hypothetical protein
LRSEPEKTDFEGDELALRELVARQPSHHGAWNALAWTYLQSGRGDLALDAARRAYEASRGNLDYLNTLGVAYGETGAQHEAEACFRKALKRNPVFLHAIVNLAKSLEKQERPAEAIPLFERAVALEPRFPRLATNLARLYCQRGDATRARIVLERDAPASDAETVAMARAECDLELDGPDAAIARLSSAVEANPHWSLANYALAHALLANGQWREGWRHYLARHELHGTAVSSLKGERIVLRGEQGLGDVLFFLRFAPLLEARGVRLALACEKKLKPLIGLEHAAEDSAGVWLGDLPHLLECDDTPPAWPLAATEGARAAARSRLAALGPGPYLAVTWRAGTDVVRLGELGAERMSLSKAIPPAQLGAALRNWPGSVIALQRGARPGEGSLFSSGFGRPFHDLSALGDDLPALLGMLAEIDDYVGVSNTNIHLLAGLGRSARVLVPYPAEWRWLRRDGRSPWFPEFSVYRQAQSRDWSAALEQLGKDLSRV